MLVKEKGGEDSSSVTNLHCYWKRGGIFCTLEHAHMPENKALQNSPPNKHSADLSESLSAACQGKEKPPVHSIHETTLQAGI